MQLSDLLLVLVREPSAADRVFPVPLLSVYLASRFGPGYELPSTSCHFLLVRPRRVATMLAEMRILWRYTNREVLLCRPTQTVRSRLAIYVSKAYDISDWLDHPPDCWLAVGIAHYSGLCYPRRICTCPTGGMKATFAVQYFLYCFALTPGQVMAKQSRWNLIAHSIASLYNGIVNDD